MKKWLLGCLPMLATCFGMGQHPDYFLTNPCLTPDGKTVVFSFEGDLWKASVADGLATRVTAMEGYETDPRVSPDGKWLAFTGRQNGNADIFVVSMNGGDVQQLTFHSANDQMDSWGWDSKTIYFTSNRYSRSSCFKTGIDGGTPVHVFGDNYFLYDHNAWENPVTGEIYFSDTWESSFQSQRKRYKGPFNPDIQSYNPKTKAHKIYTTWQGKDFWQTVDKNGHLYFASDEANGEYNLYTLEGKEKKALTRFPSSIKTPMVNANGGTVVFEKDYQLWIYDVASAKSRKLDISIVRNSILPQGKDFQVKGNINTFDVSPDGKKMAFVSRGELFVSDVEGKFVREMDRRSAERVGEVRWLKDSKTLLFSQTLGGYSNWYTMPADGSGGIKQLTSDKRNNRSASFNADRTLCVYLSGRDELRQLDLKTFKSETLVKDEIWGFQTSDPTISPNNEYVAFTAHRDFEQDILLYNLKTKKTINLTNTGVTEAGPVWSPDGKYIYFTSQLLRASYPFGMPDAHVYRLPLEKIDEPFRQEKFNELFSEEKVENKDSAKKEAANGKADSVKDKPIVIDTDRIMDRIEQVGPGFGAQNLLQVYQKGDKTMVLMVGNQDQGKSALWKVTYEPFENDKTEKIAGAESGGFDVVKSKDKYYLLFRGSIHKLNLDANKTEAIDINYTFRRNLQNEFAQMFEEAWAQIEENYYDENFHGANWPKVREYYEKFIPFLNTRSDLRVLLNDMLGELNSSHQGFSTFGMDESVQLSARTMETGILFNESNPLMVQRIVRKSPADHKDIDVQPGDLLVAVDDQKVEAGKNRNIYFTSPSLDREMKLTFSRKGKEFDVRIHPEASLQGELYDEWIDNNQSRVDQKSGNKVAYGYMKNMGEGELEQFIIDMTRELNHKDALIFDLRYNTGGNVHDEVLNFLSQRSYLKWKYRQGQFTRQPNFAPSDKPIILLINEQSLSDAEMTSQGFKALKLGTIVGNETYHWIIFTSGVGLVDGSFVRMPSWGCFTLDGKDIEHNGVAPDIRVINTFTDKLNGNDPQLDRAIEEILKQVKASQNK